MTNYWKLVNEIIRDADILLLVIDSRYPEETRNLEIERKIQQSDKKLIYVFNKCDLVGNDISKEMQKKYPNSVFVSSKKRLGGTILFKKILQLSEGKPCNVGVLGYPNVGKSSVVNLIRGKESAGVSSQSGFTKGKQLIRARNKIRLMDTPGVLPFGEKDRLKQLIIGAINPQGLKNPELDIMKIIEAFPEMFEKYLGVKYSGDAFAYIEEVAIKKNILRKGGEPDTDRLSRQLLYDWQRGKLHEVLQKRNQPKA
ncbi:MAG: GTPase [archaeon]